MQDKTRQYNIRQDKINQHKTTRNNTRQDKPSQYTKREDKIIEDNTTKYKTQQYKTLYYNIGNIRHGKTRQDNLHQYDDTR